MDYMEDITKHTEKLEQLFLDQLISLLETEAIEVEKSKQITAEFLDLQPFSSYEHMRAQMKLFGEIYPQFEPVVKKMFIEPSADTKKILDYVHNLIKEKNPGEALKSIGGVQ